MKHVFRCASVLFLVIALVLASAPTPATARSYGYRHHHFYHFGYLVRYNNYTSRAGIVQLLGN
jgi:hypothetical protein